MSLFDKNWPECKFQTWVFGCFSGFCLSLSLWSFGVLGGIIIFFVPFSLVSLDELLKRRMNCVHYMLFKELLITLKCSPAIISSQFVWWRWTECRYLIFTFISFNSYSPSVLCETLLSLLTNSMLIVNFDVHLSILKTISELFAGLYHMIFN